jgi:hypothetical protein
LVLQTSNHSALKLSRPAAGKKPLAIVGKGKFKEFAPAQLAGSKQQRPRRELRMFHFGRQV